MWVPLHTINTSLIKRSFPEPPTWHEQENPNEYKIETGLPTITMNLVDLQVLTDMQIYIMPGEHNYVAYANIIVTVFCVSVKYNSFF